MNLGNMFVYFANGPEEHIWFNIFDIPERGMGIIAKNTVNLQVNSQNIFNQGSGSFGLWLETCLNFKITRNLFRGTWSQSGNIGIYISGNCGNLIDYNTFEHLLYGAFNEGLNPQLQYRCNTFFDIDVSDIVLLQKGSQYGISGLKGTLCVSQGSPKQKAGNIFSNCYYALDWSFLESVDNGEVINYYDNQTTPLPPCVSKIQDPNPPHHHNLDAINRINVSSCIDPITNTHILDCDCEPYNPDYTTTPFQVKQDIITTQGLINDISLPLTSQEDKDLFSSLKSNLENLTGKMLEAYRDDTLIADSTELDSEKVFLQGQNNYFANTLLIRTYLDTLHLDDLQDILDGVDDSITNNPTDSEYVSFKNYYDMMKEGIENEWDSATLLSDSIDMETIAHSTSYISGNAKAWLQYYFEDLPEMMSKGVEIDTVMATVEDSIISYFPDSLTYTMNKNFLFVKIDSTVYAGGSVVSAGITTRMVHDTGTLSIGYPTPRTDTSYIKYSIPVMNEDSSFQYLTLGVIHHVQDTVLNAVRALDGGACFYNVKDSVIGWTRDSLIWNTSDSTIDSVNFYTANMGTDSVIYYTVHYTVADTIEDSIKFHTTFYSDDFGNLINEKTYYNDLHFTGGDSLYDSTVDYTVHVIGLYDSVVYHKVYYSRDSTADTVQHFTNYFTTIYEHLGEKVEIDSMPPFDWVELFPLVLPEIDTTGEGEHPQQDPKWQAQQQMSGDLRITVSPNPFHDNLKVEIENTSEKSYITKLRIINSIGVEVQHLSIPVGGLSDQFNEIDVSRLPSGLYHLLMDDGRKIVLRRGMVKE